MTANVTVETARRDDVLRVPSAALRFTPSDELLQALGSKKPAGSANQTPARNVNTLWLYDGGLHAVSVETGVSDGTVTEISSRAVGTGGGDVLEAGMPVAIREALPTAEDRGTGAASGNPLMTSPGRRF